MTMPDVSDSFRFVVKHPNLIISLSCFLLVLGIVAPASAVEVEGRLSSSSYVFETFPDENDEQEKQLDMINRLALDIDGLGHSVLSLHSLTTMRGGLLGDDKEDFKLRSYRLFLEIDPRPAFSLRLGRQWIYGGVGSGLVDGARLKLKHLRLGQLILFGGTRGYLNRVDDKLDGLDPEGFDASGSWGAQWRSPVIKGAVNAGLSAARRFRAGEEASRRFGARLGWRAQAQTRIDYEARYELALERFYYQHLRLTHRLKKGSAGLSWSRRQSYEDSWIIETFENETWFPDAFDEDSYPLIFHEVRAHVTMPCRLLAGFTNRLEIVEVLSQDEKPGHGIRLSMTGKGVEVGYRLQRGFGGDKDDLFGSLRYSPRQDMELWLELNKIYYRYGGEILEEYERDDETFASRLGLDLDLPRDLSARLAVEILQNPRAENETRFLGQLNYRFRHDSQGEEVER